MTSFFIDHLFVNKLLIQEKAMSWMERNNHFFNRGGLEGLFRYFRAAGLEKALNDLCGDYGVRRFLIRFSFVQHQTPEVKDY